MAKYTKSPAGTKSNKINDNAYRNADSDDYEDDFEDAIDIKSKYTKSYSRNTKAWTNNKTGVGLSYETKNHPYKGLLGQRSHGDLSNTPGSVSLNSKKGET
jgi:hypothetical protein